MIVLDTHFWVWWVHGDRQLIERYRTYLQAHERTQPLGVSIITTRLQPTSHTAACG